MTRYFAARGWRRTTALIAIGACGAGCSLVNAFDDLAPQKLEGDDGGVPPVDSSLPDTNAPDTSPGVDAGPDVVDANVPDTFDAGPRGVVVIGGTADDGDGGERPVLTAIDPATGSELPLARETMNVAALLYDGSRDLFYVFESGGSGPFPLPSDSFYLHVRMIDTYSGAWTELSKVEIPAGLSFTTTDELAARVVYVAYGNDTSDAGFDAGATVPSPFGLVILDTSDPTSPKVANVQGLAAAPVALVGVERPVFPAGGVAALGATTKNGATNVAQLTPVLVPATDPPQLETPIVGTNAVGGSVGFGRIVVNGVDEVVAVTRSFGAPTTPAALSIYDPSASDPTQALVATGHFAFGDGNIKAPAFAPCLGAVLVLGTNADLNLYAVSLTNAGAPLDDGGTALLTAASAPTGHSGQSVYFDPFTSTVLTPFSQGNNFALTAFTLGGSPDHPTLVQRAEPRWNPPADLRPSFVVTRSPRDFQCATPVANDP